MRNFVQFAIVCVTLVALSAVPSWAQTHSVQLTCTPPDTPVPTFNFYRRTGMNGYNGTKLASASICSYVDTTVALGTTYFYVVTAVDSSGTESVNSNEVTAVVPGVTPPPPPPPPPSNFTIDATPSALTFTGNVGATLSSQTVTIHDSTPLSLPITSISSDQPWCVVKPASGNTTLNLTVSVLTTGLASGVQTPCTITLIAGVESNGDTVNNSPFHIPVALTLNAVTPPPPAVIGTPVCTMQSSNTKLQCTTDVSKLAHGAQMNNTVSSAGATSGTKVVTKP